VPASVANLGSGFDTLAVAVRLYLRLRIVDIRDDGAATLTVVKSTPPVTGRNAVERAYQAIVRWTGLKAPSVFVEAESDIPTMAGLGSSAAAAVAGLRLFERVTQPLPEGVLLAVATSLEGHADNAAAALYGGLTSVIERERDEPVALRWQWPVDLRFVVATPSVGLSTSKARAALPDSLLRRDAVFNMQRVLSLVHALQSGEYDLLRESVRDRWHQRARAALVPQLGEVLALEDPAILASFLSGAGPSVALVARADFEHLEQLLASTYERAACPVTIRTLAVHQSSDVAREAVASAPGRNR
jgi:homoserine kinase